jgi:hypothetical protein
VSVESNGNSPAVGRGRGYDSAGEGKTGVFERVREEKASGRPRD